MKHKFSPLLAVVFLCSATRLFAQQHTAECWLENDSPYRTQTDFFGIEPSNSDVQSYMQSLALKYTIPVEVIAGICFQESQALQYDAPDGLRGFLIHNLDECRYAFHNGAINPGGQTPPPGLGLMQLTSVTATDPSIPNHDPLKDITDWRYNLEAGVQVLAQKYGIAADQAPACVAAVLNKNESRKILENWFYAIQFYNGAPTADQYRDTVYSHILHPTARIQGLFPPVKITRPEAEISGFNSNDSFAASKSGTWTGSNCATYARGAASVHLSTSFAMPYAEQLANISTRANVGTGDNVLIGGFIVTGPESKKVIIRAIGPSTGISGALADPELQLFDSKSHVLGISDNWAEGSNKADIAASGFAPKNAKESALLMTLPPGAYTAIVSGAQKATGIGLVEVYDLNTSASARLANISTRGFAQTGDNVMIGGFIVAGNAGQKLLVRALGPSLGLSGALADPTLELHNSQGDLIASNDDWKDHQQAAIAATKLAPKNNAESAILMTLAPGAYTAVVRGKNSTSGIALVEAYAIQ
jgi:hypothetical protein